MAHFRIIAALCFLVGFACETMAGTVAYKFNGMNVTREGGVTYLRGTSPSEMAAAAVTVAGQTVLTGGSVAVAYKSATFQSAVKIASTAAPYAIKAIRLNPGGLVTSAVASYLLSKGLEWVGDKWVKTGGGASVPADTGVTTINGYGSHVGYKSTLAEAVQAEINYGVSQGCSANYSQTGAGWNLVPNYGTGYHETYTSGGCGFAVALTWNCEAGYTQVPGSTPTCTKLASCPDGYTMSAGACFPQGSPATESDWEAAKNGTLPDAAIHDLLKNGVPLPVDDVASTPGTQDVPLSDPYTDPVTGKRYRDMARVTPSKTDPGVADVQTYKQEVDANGDPVGGPNGPAAEEEKDPCKQNPDASACKPLDEVEDSDLENQEINLSLNPLPGFGPTTAQCPASQTLFTRGGQTQVWEWTQFCQFSLGIRPLVIGFAWLTAIIMVVAVARRQT